MRTINAEMLRYIIEHEHGCRNAWTNQRDQRLNRKEQKVVDGEIKMVSPDPTEYETEAQERYEEAKGWLRRAMESALGQPASPAAAGAEGGGGEGG